MEQDIYTTLMGDLINGVDTKSPIASGRPNADDDNAKLRSSCDMFNQEIKEALIQKYETIKFSVGVKEDDKSKILEPCPICYTGNAQKFKIAFIGLNPYKDKKLSNPASNSFYTGKTTWKHLAEYHCPPNKDSMIQNSVYRHIAENALGRGKYYDFVLRVHQALLYNDRVFDSWEDMTKWVVQQKDENNNLPIEGDNKELGKKMKDFFLNEFWRHPTLSAEMIPYKSHTYELSTKTTQNFIDNIPGYEQYLTHLIDFLGNHTDSQSYIFFFGHKDSVINFLSTTTKISDIWPKEEGKQKYLSVGKFKSLYAKKIKRAASGTENIFYFFKWGGFKNGRRIIIAPFLSYNQGSIQIMLKANHLIEKIKDGSLFNPNPQNDN